MNTQTKVMTAAAIICYANIGIALFCPGMDTTYKIFSFILAGIAWAGSHYFNQDFTETACEKTGEMRYEKLVKSGKLESEDIDEQ